MIDWHRPAYLLDGTPRQQAAYHVLMALGVFERLAVYEPVLTGTIPLDIDTPESDLDLSLYAPDLTVCAADVRRHYGQLDSFEDKFKAQRNGDSYVARFTSQGFIIEVFAMALPVRQQHGYRHLVIEGRLLMLGGDRLRQRVRQLKCEGFKTEPAFAHVLGLAGNPYDALLALYDLDDEALRAMIDAQ